ncbi:hypothetical protein Godav_025275 [Gossypium davidsonii]|uniref:Uncharacterized protein n=1 Tax=Gossypium davidsonii TaxID=34287 RepID=A0A7J8T7V6_GOSDV|nr:hypothetical protein [Gossypium davidsonii]
MEEEKMNLRLDMDVQKLKTEKLIKGKGKVEGDLNKIQEERSRLIDGKGNSKKPRCEMRP